ncbi:LysM peptidoglycan-binding domain-containing protein [Candidatus Electronema sp. JM]|uniref:LysM peptidoglycan-binding domain-containing protein n=1 Tax=Candidatus Electronema sp. JM TaxID=3401571 RepID=UPI003AA8BA57
MERLNSLLNQIQDEYLIKGILFFQVISEQLFSASRSEWLSVALPFVILFVLMLLIPWLALRVLPWILMILFKIIAFCVFTLFFILLYMEGYGNRLIRKYRSNLPVFVYKIDGILSGGIIFIENCKSKIKKIYEKTINIRWIFRKKRWYAVSLIFAPVYIFYANPENITELKETVDCYLGKDCYQVMEGDCLGKIAERHHVSVQEIILANKEKHPQLMDNPNLIYPRLRLKIPRKGTAQ